MGAPGGGGVLEGVLCSDIAAKARSMSSTRSSTGTRPVGWSGYMASAGGSSQKAFTWLGFGLGSGSGFGSGFGFGFGFGFGLGLGGRLRLRRRVKLI